ncbi:CsbD family protein [Casimicrobium huifangae]|uniref:CsbD family protein n=1 Tax=Casimicrobium huifangae TaxID=2591109 RepID=UPI0037841419
MNKDQVEGRVDQVKGKLQEVAGKVISDEQLRAEGRANQISGKVQANYGDAKEAIRDKAKDIVDKL